MALILDCCFGGAVGKDFLKGSVNDQLQQVSDGRGIYIPTASTATQTAREKEGDEYSLFTKHILHGLAHGEADQDDDGLVSMDDLYEYVRAHVPREAPQHPMKWALGVQGGELIIARAVKSYSPERLRAFREKIKSIDHYLLDEVFDQAIQVIRANQPKPDKEFLALLEAVSADRVTVGEFNSRWLGLGVPVSVQHEQARQRELAAQRQREQEEQQQHERKAQQRAEAARLAAEKLQQAEQQQLPEQARQRELAAQRQPEAERRAAAQRAAERQQHAKQQAVPLSKLIEQWRVRLLVFIAGARLTRRQLLIGGTLALAIGLIALVIWQALKNGNSEPSNRPANGQSTPGTAIASPATTSSPVASPIAALAEVLRYRQEFEPGVRTNGIRFYFTARTDGYLYLIAPDEEEEKATLLTNRPPAEMGVRSNQLRAGREFAFPDGEWLGLAKPSAVFTLIFSPTPLTQADFLSTQEVRGLTPDELRVLEELRGQSSTRVPQVEATTNGGIITAAAADNAPLVVEITARRKATGN